MYYFCRCKNGVSEDIKTRPEKHLTYIIRYDYGTSENRAVAACRGRRMRRAHTRVTRRGTENDGRGVCQTDGREQKGRHKMEGNAGRPNGTDVHCLQGMRGETLRRQPGVNVGTGKDHLLEASRAPAGKPV